MSSSSTKWPSHIEHYNLELAMQTDFDSIEFEDNSIDDRSNTSSIQPEQFVATKKRGFGESTTTATTTTAIEHFNPIDPSKPSANETASITTLKQETKRRKSNCSSKPQKIHNANTKHHGNKTNRKIREVRVYSSDSGVMLHSFPNCAEAGRKMHVGKSRINHGECLISMRSECEYLIVCDGLALSLFEKVS